MEGEQRKGKRFRKLRIVFLVVCGIACVLLIAMWVRSYFTWDAARLVTRDMYLVEVASLRGKAGVCIEGPYDGNRPGWSFLAESAGRSSLIEWQLPFEEGDNCCEVLGFQVVSQPGALVFNVPYWFAIIAVVSIGIVTCLSPSWRFSLRALLLVMTLVAAMLGIIAVSR